MSGFTSTTTGVAKQARQTPPAATSEVLERDAVADERAFYLQAAFRALLDAMARPGEVTSLPAAPASAQDAAARSGLTPETVILSDVLLDAATSFAVAGEDAEATARALARRTRASILPVEEAAFLIIGREVRGESAAEVVRAAQAGTLEEPHRGATLIVECGTLVGVDRNGAFTGSAAGSCQSVAWELSGPGVDGEARMASDRSDVVAARNDRADEFPCGIDLVLVDGAGHVCCVPRSSACVPTALEGMETEGARSWDM